MRIYTEVNYIWKDNKLVQTDSESFEYSGEVDKCHWYHRHGGNEEAKKAVTSTTSAVKEAVKKVKKDNPKPNLNVQTPKKIYEKTRQAVHNAATVASEFIDRNTDSITNLYPDENDDFTNSNTTNNNPLTEDDDRFGNAFNRRLASNLAGQSTLQRRGVEEKKKLAPSLINQRTQRSLASNIS